MLVSYTGGGMFSNSGDAQNGIIQELSFQGQATRFAARHFPYLTNWAILPESSFGFAGTAGAGLPGGGSSGLGIGLYSGAIAS